MAKLWQKGYDLDKQVEDYTVGNDFILDDDLIEYDILGSIAHARMLERMGVLSADELVKIEAALKDILKLHEKGEFRIRKEDEDVHTAVESHLTEKLGDTGKKIHTARSRNDQVLLDVRLYSRDRMLELAESLSGLIDALLSFAAKHEGVPLVGRTHTQKAMPSSVGLWAGAFAESLLDDLSLIQGVYAILDQNPLGSAAAYGANFPLDRALTAALLGFSGVQNNVLYCANSRGKFESIILSACAQVMLDLSRLSADIIFWSIPETCYLSLPDELFSGSSLMPQKKNPCALELARGNASIVLGYFTQVFGVTSGLVSGYNRDVQLTKEPLMRGLKATDATVKVLSLTVKKLKVNKKRCLEAFTPEVFATDEALRMVSEGVPFRDAYRKVAENIGKLRAQDPVKNIKSKRHAGATGNLGLAKAKSRLKKARSLVSKEKKKTTNAYRRLLS